jgi:hypothetical protein
VNYDIILARLRPWCGSTGKPAKWSLLPQRRIPPEWLECGWSKWSDPIGAAYSEWAKMSDDQRVRLMTETAIDLAMQGYALEDVLTAFAQVREFRAFHRETHSSPGNQTAARPKAELDNAFTFVADGGSHVVDGLVNAMSSIPQASRGIARNVGGL